MIRNLRPDVRFVGEPGGIIAELARVKAVFQQRTILLHMGVDPDRLPAPHSTTDRGEG